MTEIFDFDDFTELTDPVVHVHLMTGKIIGLENVSITTLGKALMNNGFAFLSDGEGSYAIFFNHGVAALTTENQ